MALRLFDDSSHSDSSLSLSLMSFVSHLCLLCAEGNGLTQDFSLGSLVSSSLSLKRKDFLFKLFPAFFGRFNEQQLVGTATESSRMATKVALVTRSPSSSNQLLSCRYIRIPLSISSHAKASGCTLSFGLLFTFSCPPPSPHPLIADGRNIQVR